MPFLFAREGRNMRENGKKNDADEYYLKFKYIEVHWNYKILQL